MSQPLYIPGKALTATIGGADMPVKKSNITAKVDVVKVTNKKSGGAQEVVAGIKSFSGSITVSDASDGRVTVAEGTIVAVVVGVTGGRQYSGNALITQVQDSADVNGEYDLTINVESTGIYTAA